jgi:hypothetical protein
MRKLLFTFAVALVPAAVFADSDTAYKALRVFGKQSGEKMLNRVIEVRGRNGVPQPDVWKVIASDPAARGGLVEAEVQRGKIISQRTPTARATSATQPMDFNQLNLDSDGAFTVANQELQKQKTPFDRIDYLLRSPGNGKPPVWHLDLYDRGAKIGTMEVAADSGIVLEQQLQKGRAPEPDYSRDRDYVDSRRTPDRDYAVDRRDPGWSDSGEPFRGVGDFFHRLGKRFERRGHQLKRFFGGD